MARKPSPDASDNAALKDHIRDSAKHIWLAGLRAFAKAMHRLGWPSADDVAALHARITTLEQALANTKPAKTAAPAKRQATQPTVAKRPTAQRAATQGPVAKTAKPVATPTRAAIRSTRSPQR